MKAEVLPGESNPKQYQNLEFLDNGGMSDIYTATDVVANEKVAVKVIRVTDKEYRDLLEEEFKISKSISHENVLKTSYYGEHTENKTNYFYSVMEYLPNGSLRNKVVTAQAPFPIQQCLDYFYDLLRGLQEAHKYIIHRDLKPENILVGDNDRLKICDFGIAKYVDHLTRTKTFKGWGTYPYMAPECWLHDANTKQMDIYSLGIIFFEILTLQMPYKGPTESDFRNQHLFQNLPLLPDLRKDAPITLSEIIRKMTAKAITERYKLVEEVIAALDKVVETQKPSGINVQSVIGNFHKRVNAETEAKLKEQKAKEENEQKQLLLNYSIEQLFDRFSRVADVVNESLVSEKIHYKKHLLPNAAASDYRLSFSRKNLNISFYNPDIIPQYIAGRREQIINNQMKMYGIVMNNPEPEYIETDNIKMIGKVLTDVDYKGAHYGFNVLLKMNSSEDVYGEWWIAKFSLLPEFSNVPAPDVYFSSEPMDFFKHYQTGRQRISRQVHMDFRPINDDDIVGLLEKMAL